MCVLELSRCDSTYTGAVIVFVLLLCLRLVCTRTGACIGTRTGAVLVLVLVLYWYSVLSLLQWPAVRGDARGSAAASGGARPHQPVHQRAAAGHREVPHAHRPLHRPHTVSTAALMYTVYIYKMCATKGFLVRYVYAVCISDTTCATWRKSCTTH